MSWIKMETHTPDKPEIFEMAEKLSIDPDLVFAKCFRIWAWFDAHTTNGKTNGSSVSELLVDRISCVNGFAKAMLSVGWLATDSTGLTLPNFDRHNGETAKGRALTAKRVAKHANGKTNGSSVSSALPREDKNKNINTPIPPDGGKTDSKKKTAISLQTFLDNCKTSSEKPIPENDPVFDYAESVGLTLDILRIHWHEFKSRYTLPDAKRYKNWRDVYRKSVRGNWFKIWYIGPDGSVGLTTVGIQAQRASA